MRVSTVNALTLNQSIEGVHAAEEGEPGDQRFGGEAILIMGRPGRAVRASQNGAATVHATLTKAALYGWHIAIGREG